MRLIRLHMSCETASDFQQRHSPIGPAPMMATVLPGVTPARLTACTPTDRGSTMAPSSCDRWSGTRKQKSAGWSTNCAANGTLSHWNRKADRCSGEVADCMLPFLQGIGLSRSRRQTRAGKLLECKVLIPLCEGATHGCERGCTCAKDPWCGGVAKNLMSGSRLYRPSLQDPNAVVKSPLGE